MIIKKIVFYFLCLITLLCFLSDNAAQQTEVGGADLFRSLVSDITGGYEEDDPNLEHLLEVLEELTENPVYINEADFDELARIIWLSEFQIKSLLEHINKYGAILSHFEIATLWGFTPELTQTLLPFISLEKKPEEQRISPERALKFGRNRLIAGTQRIIEDQEGYIRHDSIANRYAGSPVRANLRYSFNYANKLYFGVSANKDAGEPFFRKNNPYGFDFYSAHFQINTNRRIKTLTLGDFRADFGQGLVMWSGMNFGKSAMTFNAMRFNSGLRRYTSLGKTRFLRGAGVTLRFNPAEVSLFYSRKAIDATVTDRDENGRAITVSSFPTDGYHRTPTEIARKGAAIEQIAGTNIAIRNNNWHVGATAVYYNYDVEVIPNSYVYNQYAFKGSYNSNYSVDFRFRLGDAILYGEHAIAQNGAQAMLYGTQMLLSEHITANILYRRYAKDFHAHYGAALGENSRNNNEEGFYMGLNWNTGGLWRFSGYYDIFRFPWLRHRAYAPTSGQDAMIRADYAPTRNTNMYIQARYREREENANAENIVRAVTNVKTNSIKIVFSHQIIEGFGTGNHVEFKNYSKENAKSKGYFISQDIYVTFITFNSYPLRITLRYAFFDTDDYNSRIYSFENDMLYAFAIPAFHLQGSRLYVLTRYTLGKGIDLRFKYATTKYTNRNEIGSGLNRIQGNRQSEIKAQLVCRF